jgi:adenylate kinase family enzyme
MKKVYFILSQSGGGKDTQAGKLIELLQKQGIKYLYLSIGDCVRGTVSRLGTDNFFAKKMKFINDQGKLQPGVIPIHFFLSQFIHQYTGEEVVIINGSPRSELEINLWASLVSAGYLPEARIIHLDVDDEECCRRLDGREGRSDTENPEARKIKMAWYEPIRRMLAGSLPDGVGLVTIDGMGSSDEVFAALSDYFREEGIVL